MSVVRFVHIGDTHLGPGPKADEKRRILASIVDRVLGDDTLVASLGAWLWPGDLNHGRMTIEDRNFLAAHIGRMASVAPVVICYGNHDLPGDLDVFAKLGTTYPVRVIGEPCILHDSRADFRIKLCVLPYPTKGGIVANGHAVDDTLPAAADALDAIFAGWAMELAAAPDALHLAIGHVNVAGSRASNGQPQIGREVELNPASIARLGGLYVGLNHIHAAQHVGGASYAGSICRLDWGERERKSFSVITYMGGLEGWSYEVERVPIDVTPMWHVEGRLTRDGFTWDDGQERPASWRGCEVRVRYRFKASEKALLSEATILAEFAEAARLQLDPVAEPDRSIRAPQIAAAVTLAQKLEAWCVTNGRACTPSLRAKLQQLETQPAADVVAAVTAVAVMEEEEVPL